MATALGKQTKRENDGDDRVFLHNFINRNGLWKNLMHPFRTGALAAVSVLSLGVSLLASPLATAAPTPLVGTAPDTALNATATQHAAYPDWPGQPPRPARKGAPLSCVPVHDNEPAATNAQDFDELPLARVAGLPTRVDMRDNTSSYNRKWEITLKDGQLYTRPRHSTQAWRLAPMPSCLRGQLIGVSMDAEEIVALDRNGWVYTMFEAQENTAEWYWKTAWGSLLRAEDGFQMANTHPSQWSLSIINIDDDKYYTDKDGVTHHISLAGCTQLLELSPDGHHLFSHDPWLPNDYSYEWGTPVQSRFIAQSVSASGSVALITNKYGDLYTRMWDYDYSGGDPAQFRYTFTKDTSRHEAANWFDQRLNPTSPKIRVPVPDWTQQPKIPGEITDRLSVESVAVGSSQRLLKVEGRKNGVTGYWKKMLNDRHWTFVPTGLPLRGTLLENSPRDRTMDTLAPASPLNYRGKLPADASLTVPHFAYQSPHQPVTLTVGGKSYPITMHTVYGRLGTMASQELFAHSYGVTQQPRRYAIAFELPSAVWKAQRSNPALAAFVKGYLRGERIHTMYMTVTSDAMTLLNPLVPGISLTPQVAELARY